MVVSIDAIVNGILAFFDSVRVNDAVSVKFYRASILS